ncbi:hypothetical protein C8R45DRAFT_335918 [Mycena sanguinolenta]|nr:hypothetical protein C8R45DRAFT_335918 [Mycena sanguinolenta]
MDTGLPRKVNVVTKVRKRDKSCRLTGVEFHKQIDSEDEDMEDAEDDGDNDDDDEPPNDQGSVPVVRDNLQVAHCIPYKTGETSFLLLERLTGIKFMQWKADCVENAFLTRPAIHEQFAAFRIYFEWVQTEIMIRGRTGKASPVDYLAGLVNDRRVNCLDILNTPLRPRSDTGIADMDPKYFTLHKYIGDIVWMAGGADPVSDEEDEEEAQKVLSGRSLDVFIERLRCPEMDLLPRQSEGILFSSMDLVPKEMVWV